MSTKYTQFTVLQTRQKQCVIQIYFTGLDSHIMINGYIVWVHNMYYYHHTK